LRCGPRQSSRHNRPLITHQENENNDNAFGKRLLLGSFWVFCLVFALQRRRSREIKPDSQSSVGGIIQCVFRIVKKKQKNI
jgi:hypothetical protein